MHIYMHVIFHLLTIPVQPMRAGIGREASCTVVDCISSRLVSFPDPSLLCMCTIPRAWEWDYISAYPFSRRDCSCKWEGHEHFKRSYWVSQLHKNYVTYLCYSCCKEASWDARQARHTAKQNSPSAEGKGWFDPCWLHESWGRKTVGYLWPPTAWDSCHATT